MHITVFYAREGVGSDIASPFGQTCLGRTKPYSIGDLSDTHTDLGVYEAASPDALFVALQASETWPTDNIAQRIEAGDLSHASMSCGDVVAYDGVHYECSLVGWRPLNP